LSIHENQTINCPKCANEQNAEIWSSINVSLNPEGRNKLFDGEINRFKCEDCGYEALIPAPLLYHDPDRKFAVHYFPAESIKKINFLEQFDLYGKLNVGDKLDFDIPEYMLDIHIVFNMDELITFVIFREMLLEFHQQNQDSPAPSMN